MQLHKDDAGALLARMYGMDYHQIADTFGISRQEATDRVFRGMKFMNTAAMPANVKLAQSKPGKLGDLMNRAKLEGDEIG